MIQTLLTAVTPLIGQWFENEADRKKAIADLALVLANSEHALLKEQSKTNQMEAQHKSLFVAGWRPFIGWVCGIGLLYGFLLQPVLTWFYIGYFQTNPGFPTLDIPQIIGLVTGMLGLGSMRTVDKVFKVSTEAIKTPKYNE